MAVRRALLTAAGALALIGAVGAVGAVGLGLRPSAPAPGPDPREAALEVAVLGDTPYGPAQRRQFPALVQDVDADPRVRLVLHAGDVKDGATPCDDAVLADVAALLATFDDPLVLTPGDNEWTDCHRSADRRYVPLDRLDAVRRTLFAEPGRTLGGRLDGVASQAADPRHGAHVENVRFVRGRVVVASVHVVGSANGLAPWSGLPGGDRRDARLAEVAARSAAALAWVDAAFDQAEAERAAGVLLLMQAEPLPGPGTAAVRDRLLQRARRFGRPVLLVHGDEHRYEAEAAYGGVAGLTRLETFGDTATQWLRLRIDPADPAVFSWTPQRVGPPGG